jgi:hypothetical protein
LTHKELIDWTLATPLNMIVLLNVIKTERQRDRETERGRERERERKREREREREREKGQKYRKIGPDVN